MNKYCAFWVGVIREVFDNVRLHVMEYFKIISEWSALFPSYAHKYPVFETAAAYRDFTQF